MDGTHGLAETPDKNTSLDLTTVTADSKGGALHYFQATPVTSMDANPGQFTEDFHKRQADHPPPKAVHSQAPDSPRYGSASLAARSSPEAPASRWAALRASASRCLSMPRHMRVALVVLAVSIALAVPGAVLFCRTVHMEQRKAVGDVARSAARSVETFLDNHVAPVHALAAYIATVPHWPTLNATFSTFAEAIYKNNPFYQIEPCPYGIVGAMSMPWLNLTGEALAQAYRDFDLNLDLLLPNDEAWDRNVHSIMANGSIAVLGPWYAGGELEQGALVFRFSVFLPPPARPEEWDMPPSSIAYCPPDICTAPDNTTFWGFSAAVVAWKNVARGLAPLIDRRMHFYLAPDPRALNQSYLAVSHEPPNPASCEVVHVAVFDWLTWTLCVEPSGGWGPMWAPALIVGAVLVCFLLAGLVFTVLRSRAQALRFLQHEQRTTAQLAELTAWLDEERHRSDRLLYQMLPPGIAQVLKAEHKAPCHFHPEATILFSDIVGFTEIASRCTPLEVCQMLDDLYHEFDTLLEHYPMLYKVETIGDAYMLVGNVTAPCPRHADLVLEFGILMHQRAAGLRIPASAGPEGGGGQPLRIRVGVHSGSVVSGVVGKRMPRFCLFGDTVNIASRMESHGLPGHVHLSDAAYGAMRAAKEQFTIMGRGVIDVKGKGKMQTYLVVPANEEVPLDGRHAAEHAQLMEQQQQKEQQQQMQQGGGDGPLDPSVHMQLAGLPSGPQPRCPASLSARQLDMVFSTTAATAAAAVGSTGTGTGAHSTYSEGHSGAGGSVSGPAGRVYSGMSGISPRAVGMAGGPAMPAGGWSRISGGEYGVSYGVSYGVGGGGGSLLSGWPSVAEASAAVGAGRIANTNGTDGGNARARSPRSAGVPHSAFRGWAGGSGGGASPGVRGVFGFCTVSGGVSRPNSAGLRNSMRTPSMGQALGSPTLEAALAAALATCGGSPRGALGTVPPPSRQPLLLQLAGSTTQRAALASGAGPQPPRRPQSGLAATVGGVQGAAVPPPPPGLQSRDMPRVQLAGRSGSRSLLHLSGSLALPLPPGLGSASAASNRSGVPEGRQQGTLGEVGKDEDSVI